MWIIIISLVYLVLLIAQNRYMWRRYCRSINEKTREIARLEYSLDEMHEKLEKLKLQQVSAYRLGKTENEQLSGLAGEVMEEFRKSKRFKLF